MGVSLEKCEMGKHSVRVRQKKLLLSSPIVVKFLTTWSLANVLYINLATSEMIFPGVFCIPGKREKNYSFPEIPGKYEN